MAVRSSGRGLCLSTEPGATYAGPSSTRPMPSTISRRGVLAAGGGIVATLAAAGLDPDRTRPEMRLDARVPDGSWPRRKRDPARTGYQPDSGPRAGASLRWRTPIPRDPTTVPAVVATPDRVLVAGAGAAFALRPGDGSRAWRTRHRERALLGEDRGEFVQAGPQVVGDRTFTVADTTLYALGTDAGSRDWAYETSSSFRAVLAAGNTVFLGSLVGDTDRLVALSAATGLPYWTVETVAVPLVYAPDADLLVTGRSPARVDDGVLQGRDPRSGAVEWTVQRPELPFIDATAPAVAGGRLFVATGPVYAFDAADGTELWRAPLDGGGLQGPVTDGDRVYVAGERRVVALDPVTGEERWTTPVESRGFGAPALAADRLYVPTERGVAGLATPDGSVAFRATVPGGRPSGLAVADGTLYARTGRGAYALEGPR